jgi:hypothetical protein
MSIDYAHSELALRAETFERQYRQCCQDHAGVMDEVKRLRAALSAACGYMRNASIDLSTGCPKATAIRTIEGGLKLAEAALNLKSTG